MAFADRIRDGLIATGLRTPASVVRVLSGAVNFLDTGERLREHGLRVSNRVASQQEVFDVGIQCLSTGRRPLYLEFGVYTGASFRYWVKFLTNPHARLIGFDSFEGLPEHWNPSAPKGKFSTQGLVPDIADDRVEFIKGWFDQSLATFTMPEHDRLFINVDCDLYSSAAAVLAWATPYIRLGGLLYFDEFQDRFNEARAFFEFLDTSGHRFEIVAATRGMKHVLFRRNG